MRRAHLLRIQHGDQWARSDSKSVDSGTVKYNRYDPMADPMHETARL